MKNLAEHFRTQLLRAAENDAEPKIEHLGERPIFMLGPKSFLGLTYGGQVAAAASGLVAAIDDVSNEPTIHGVPRWTSRQFLERAKQYPNAVALDFSYSLPTRVWAAKLCDEAAIPRYDCVVAQAQLGLLAVFEPVRLYRSNTIARLDDFLALANRLDDDLSRATLFAHLLLRINYDRKPILQTWASPQDEYFSAYVQPSTFTLGAREHFCDCGASQGPIIRKFLDATRYKYASITAVEPDRINFDILKNLTPIALRDYRLINKAVSNEHQVVKFMETGSISSYVSAEGTIEVETTRLDDELSDLTFLKLDVEGFEAKALQGGAGLLRSQRPRVAVCVYHNAQDLLDVMDQFDQHVENYHFRLRHTGGYYFDLVLYASPVAGSGPAAQAQ